MTLFGFITVARAMTLFGFITVARAMTLFGENGRDERAFWPRRHFRQQSLLSQQEGEENHKSNEAEFDVCEFGDDFACGERL